MQLQQIQFEVFTLIAAIHQPHASLSFDRENTSTSIPSVNNAGWGIGKISSGGNRT